MVKISTWNINSVRARIDSISQWIDVSAPDVIMMQETKCEDHAFPEDFFIDLGYNVYYSGQKSYNGVAIASKYKLEIETKKLPIYDLYQEEDNEVRFIEGYFSYNDKVVRVASVYVPNGNSELMIGEKLEDSKRFIYKLRFFDRLIKHMDDLKGNDELIIFGGDYNVAHQAIDLYNPNQATGDVGFHDLEREKMQNIIDIGYVDAFRFANPEKCEYSWWDYRRSGWEMNKGWRIDYLMCNQAAMSLMDSCVISKCTRNYVKPSDHCPVELILKI